jgi:large subunit ribosomal protein L28
MAAPVWRRNVGRAALTARRGFAYIAPFARGAHQPWRAPFFTSKALSMSRRCELTGVGPMVGHNVSHSNIKSKRRFLPALKTTRLTSESLGQAFNLRITNAALRTLDFRGGLDAFLVKANDADLSPRALKIKRQVKAKLATTPAA